jgi:predicted MFS family arabinose efflux permease
MDFPLNFQLVFALGALGAVMSSYHLYHLRPVMPMQEAREVPARPIGSLLRPGSFRLPDAPRVSIGLRFLARSGGKPMIRADLLRGPFGSVLLSFLVFYAVQHLPIPLFPVFWVNELGLSDSAISVGQAGFNGAMFLGSLLAGPVRQRIGRRSLVLASGALYGAYPLFNGLARDEWLFWAGSVAGGVLWGLLNVGLIDYLFDNVPDDDRPAHMALHNLTLNAGILAGSLMGPIVASSIGLRATMFVAAGLRLAAAGVFALTRR